MISCLIAEFFFCPLYHFIYIFYTPIQMTVLWAGIAQSVYRLATGWTVRGSNSSVGKIFHTRPDRRWGPPCLLYNGYRVYFPGSKATGVALTTHLHLALGLKKE
jgi:hypothetical protein